MKNGLFVLTLTLAFLGGAIPAKSQSSPIKVYVDLLIRRITVIDNKGRLVSNLRGDNFRGWACPVAPSNIGKSPEMKRKDLDDCLPFQFDIFEPENVPPVRGVAGQDVSGSTRPYLDELSKKATVWLFEEILLKDNDLGMIVEFDEKQRVVVGWTRDTEEIKRAQESLQPGGLSAITDTLFFLATTVMADKQIAGFTKIAVVVTDGLDNFHLPIVKDTEDGVEFCPPEERVAGRPALCRVVQNEDLAIAVQKADFRLFIVNLSKKYGSDRLSGSFQKPEDLAKKLSALAQATGGEHFSPKNPEDAKEAIEEIRAQIGQIYTLGSYVQSAKSGWYDIHIEVGEYDENGRFNIFKKYRLEYPRRWYLDPRKKK